MPGGGVTVQADPGRDTSGTNGSAVSGYAIVLPTGWRRIPVRHGTKAAVRGIANEVLHRFSEGVSRDKMTPLRIELERYLLDMAKRARSAGGVDLYLPVEYMHGTAVPASFVVSQVTLPVDLPAEGLPTEGLPPEGLPDSAQVVACLTSMHDGASAVSVAGVPAVRTESVAKADPAQGIETGSRRADYMIPLPGHGDRWVVVTFSTIGDGDPEGNFAKLLVELFDAIMLTFRWGND